MSDWREKLKDIILNGIECAYCGKKRYPEICLNSDCISNLKDEKGWISVEDRLPDCIRCLAFGIATCGSGCVYDGKIVREVRFNDALTVALTLTCVVPFATTVKFALVVLLKLILALARINVPSLRMSA